MKAVVVGSTFGSVYAEGIKIADDVELAGIVGRGSKRSAALAASYGVPLYQGANAVPAKHRSCLCRGKISHGWRRWS